LGMCICSGFRDQFGRDRMYLQSRNRHMREPGHDGHAAVAVGMRGREATLIAEIELLPAPLGLLGTQRFIDIARRIDAGQHQMESAMRNNRAVRSSEYVGDRSLLELSDAVENMPLG